MPPFKTTAILAAAFATLSTPTFASRPAEARRPDGPRLSIESLSTHADLVTDGDARLLVASPTGSLEGLRIFVGDADVTSSFTLSGRQAEGVVDGLRDGPNIVRASAPGLAPAQLTVINHSAQGPLISGPQRQPWICQAAGDPGETDSPADFASGRWDNCAFPASFRYFYRSTVSDCVDGLDSEKSCFKPYAPDAPRPEDMAETRTDDGQTLDYIVRVEHGAINRGVYDLAVLYRPDRQVAVWNGKLVYGFGGASGNVMRQLPPASSWVNDDALGLGFMSVVSSLTDASLNSNRVLSAETVLMLREHVSDRYGRVRYLIGEGCSAGSIQQMVIGSMYPGLIDGALVSCSFADSETAALESVDSMMLGAYFDSPAFAASNVGLSAEEIARKQTVMAGHKDTGTVQSWKRYFTVRTPGLTGAAPFSNGCKLPNTWIYDPQRNPDGVRCTIADLSVNIWGRDPGERAARAVYDNVGVQYGLAAYLGGSISAEDFVALNEGVGGVDADFNHVAGRSEASTEGLRIAYEAGIVSDPHSLAKMPIIDLRGDDNSSVHTTRASFALRDRLRTGNGNLDNYAMWRVAIAGAGGPWQDAAWRRTGLPRESLLAMDRWLDGVSRDPVGAIEARIRRNRPADVQSFCYLDGDYRTRITDERRCDADPALKPYSSIRRTAGGPAENDILKCRLRPVTRADYGDRMTPAQFARLQAVFEGGVCDWTRPGVGQGPSSPWRSFAEGPGGRPLATR